MASKTLAQILTEISNKILTGGRRTTAVNTRSVLTDLADSSLNKKDGGLVVEALTGYTTDLTPTDDKHFASKKYVDDNGGTVPDSTEATAGKSSLISDVEVSTYTTQNENTLPAQIAKVLSLRGLANLWNRIRLFFNEKIFVTDFSVNTSIGPTTTDSVYRNTSSNNLFVTPTGGTSINGSTSTPLQVPPGWAVVLKRDNNNDPLQFIGYSIPPNLLSVFVTNDYAYVGLMDVLADKVTLTAVQDTGNNYILASPILSNFPNLLMVRWNSTPPTGNTNIKIGTLPYTGIYRFDGTPLQIGDIALGKTYIATPQIFGANLVYVMHGVGVSSGPGYTAENVANKKTDLSSPNNTDYPTTQAVATAINAAVAGLLDLRGTYDASTGVYPTTGGSGVLGAVLKGDFWYISVAGTIGGVSFSVGDGLVALVDAPGQIAGNWDPLETNIGYVPENVVNKATTMTGNTTSNVLYLTAKAVFDWVTATFQALNANLTAISGITTAANKIIYWTGAGTAASTDLTPFARSVIGKDGRVTFGDTNFAIPSNVSTVATSVLLTATRTATLPLANTLQAGERIVIDDGGGFINGTNRLIVAASGSDTINGNATELLQRPKGRREFISNGVNMWAIDSNLNRDGFLKTFAWCSISQNLADATSYYSGTYAGSNLQPNDGIYRSRISSSYSRYEIDFHASVGGTLGTTEDATLFLRKNASAIGEITIGTAKFNATINSYTFSGTCSLVEGDLISIRLLTPTWTTNPASVFMYAELRLFK